MDNNHLHIIVAMTRQKLIGAGGKLPWNLRGDLALFRERTIGRTVVMGRRTFAGIGAPLPGRHNLVVSSHDIATAGIEIFTSLESALVRAVEIGKDTYCIGGVEIYRAVLPLAGHLHISWVDEDYEGDTFFPDFDLDEWIETAREPHAGFTHITYRRK